MRLILVCITLLFMIGCKQMVNSQPIIKTENKKDHFITQIMQAPLASPPIGDKHVLYPFATHWEHAETENEHSGSEKAFDELAGNLDKQSQSEQSYSITLTIENLKQVFNIPYDIYSDIIDDILKQEIKVHVEKLANSPHFDLFLLTTESLDLKCNPCEYESKFTLQTIISISADKIIDKLVVAYKYGSDIGRSYRFFYYNKEKIIIRELEHDEINSFASEITTYQLSSQGKFIRYYDENGPFQNQEEQGLVQNHTREGLWIEMKPNGYSHNNTYLEAEYKNGLPVNIWKFYQLEQQYNELNEPILSTRKKGKLLYTETYKDGELVERKFVAKEIDELN
ncbi:MULTISPECIES: hypothetical protein [unclassified Gilliamella]|uniref:hypothetical protein n=1 Tax=unclassified Gilliamella TaxID=2685620 RepID=UPI00130A5036|nr:MULTISPECIES: hypothetical protein [unclassified Gilliamella]MWP50363.1 hypothetical protein [Gilliamella sp. Lep-s35]MWP70093.1 hypothetical protein [Gilliamella sp. Lep-s5]MWP78323.1 hypothetical protein [Gilliamella sp. Lep-s21]